MYSKSTILVALVLGLLFISGSTAFATSVDRMSLTNLEGYAGVVTHGQEGLLVPPKDSAELAKALVFLLKDKSLRQQMSAKGRITAENYSWERIAKRVCDYYLKVLGGAVPVSV